MQLLKLFVNDCSRIFAAHHHGADNAEFNSARLYSPVAEGVPV